MEQLAIGSGIGRSGRPMLLESGTRRYPILSLAPESCLIEAPDGATLRGFADIFEGERHVASCLIVLAAPEGANLRCFFKRRTAPRAGPPRDFAR
jgi:hypothetical protein